MKLVNQVHWRLKIGAWTIGHHWPHVNNMWYGYEGKMHNKSTEPLRTANSNSSEVGRTNVRSTMISFSTLLNEDLTGNATQCHVCLFWILILKAPSAQKQTITGLRLPTRPLGPLSLSVLKAPAFTTLNVGNGKPCLELRSSCRSSFRNSKTINKISLTLPWPASSHQSPTAYRLLHLQIFWLRKTEYIRQ